MFSFSFYLFAHKKVVKQLVRWGVRRWADINARNLEGHTALDIFERQPEEQQNIEISNLLKKASALRASDVRPVSSDGLPYVTRKLPRGTRDINLMVAILVVTATYQAGLTPPGGFWQDNYQPSKLTNTSTPTAGSEPPHKAGKVILDSKIYIVSQLFNTAAFVTAAIVIGIHLPILSRWSRLLGCSLLLLSFSYLLMPLSTSSNNFIVLVSLFVQFLSYTMTYIWIWYSRLRKSKIVKESA